MRRRRFREDEEKKYMTRGQGEEGADRMKEKKYKKLRMGRRRCRYSIMKRKKCKTIEDEEKKVHIQ